MSHISSRDGANSGFVENRISEYLLFCSKWAVFVFSKRKTAFWGLQNPFFASSASKNRVNPVFQKPYSIPNFIPSPGSRNLDGDCGGRHSGFRATTEFKRKSCRVIGGAEISFGSRTFDLHLPHVCMCMMGKETNVQKLCCRRRSYQSLFAAEGLFSYDEHTQRTLYPI